MQLDNELINHFLTGTLGIFALVLIGGALANVFRVISRRFSFTRTALILALPPLCLSQCVDRSSLDTLYLFAIIITVLGFLIDGALHLAATWHGEEDGKPARSAKTADEEKDDKRIVWEKAE